MTYLGDLANETLLKRRIKLLYIKYISNIFDPFSYIILTYMDLSDDRRKY